MVGDAARRHQYGIEAHIAEIMVALAGEPGLGGGHDAGPLSVSDRPGRILEFLPRLHLDENQQLPAPRDDVDLADRAAPAPRQDAKAFGYEIRRGAAFRRDPQPERDLALRLRDPVAHRTRGSAPAGSPEGARTTWPVTHARGPILRRASAPADRPRGVCGR